MKQKVTWFDKPNGGKVRVMYNEDEEQFIKGVAEMLITPNEAPVEAFVKSGDEGCGRPGSLEFKLAAIKQSNLKRDIMDICDVEFDNRLSVADMREAAIKYLEDKENGNS